MQALLDDFSRLEGYLDGREFSENLTISFHRNRVVPRTQLLSESLRGKSVLHIGCCDHVPSLQAKLNSGEWLHRQLMDVAQNVVGIDIDPEAVATVRRLAQVDNVFTGDITAPAKIPQIAESRFDCAVFGEVLEHIGNPVAFLSAFIASYAANVSTVIITVPNAFRAGNFLGAFRNRETINTDHRFFFTPYTLAKVAVDAGIAPKRIVMASFSQKSLLQRAVLNSWPLFAENVILFGDLGAKPSRDRD